ncbi:MAG: hypothetical protein WA908_04475 [Pontixanthobacter sp.]
MKTDLRSIIHAKLPVEAHPDITLFATQLALESGAVAALFYGSNLRTGELDGVLDFYLLTPGLQREWIWPLVSYHEREFGGRTLRAKAATMSLAKFREAAAGRSRDTTIWTRFVQPSALLWHRDDTARKQVEFALEDAAITAARYAAALGPESGREAEYWRALFRETYKAEFRVEAAGREESIIMLNSAHFDGLLPAAWKAGGIYFKGHKGIFEPTWPPHEVQAALRDWKRNRRWGRFLNVVRLLKASTTFEGAARYGAWKIERHTGVPVTLTPWRERHPVLAAPGVLFRVWKTKRARPAGR